MDRHLVAVKVRVKRRTDERVKLDRAAFDQYRFKGLDAESVKGRRAVQKYRMVLDDFVEHIPDEVAAAFHLTARGFNVLRVTVTHDFTHHEGLEQFQCHFFRQTALVQFQFRTDHNNGTARVVNTLAQEVLAEASLLALQKVRQ